MSVRLALFGAAVPAFPTERGACVFPWRSPKPAEEMCPSSGLWTPSELERTPRVSGSKVGGAAADCRLPQDNRGTAPGGRRLPQGTVVHTAGAPGASTHVTAVPPRGQISPGQKEREHCWQVTCQISEKSPLLTQEGR